MTEGDRKILLQVENDMSTRRIISTEHTANMRRQHCSGEKTQWMADREKKRDEGDRLNKIEQVNVRRNFKREVRLKNVAHLLKRFRIAHLLYKYYPPQNKNNKKTTTEPSISTIYSHFTTYIYIIR